MPISFLSLPPEIRNRIYDFAIGKHYNGVAGVAHSPLDEHYDLFPLEGLSIAQPALSRTSRQIRAETLSMFYSSHIFHITLSFATMVWVFSLPGGWHGQVMKWDKVLGPHAHHIRVISFSLYGYPERVSYEIYEAVPQGSGSEVMAFSDSLDAKSRGHSFTMFHYLGAINPDGPGFTAAQLAFIRLFRPSC